MPDILLLFSDCFWGMRHSQETVGQDLDNFQDMIICGEQSLR